ncbi:MAG TPA: PhoX family phosphatase, partial [Rhizobiales bacterium]|nr:PhoX family phosphatase [Hyphomicrobiales bacterium]
LISTVLSRRRLLAGLAAGALATRLPGTSKASVDPAPLKFDPVTTSNLDTITLPEGFNWHVVVSWGDPLWSRGEEFDPVTRGTGTSQELAFGDNNDGMSLFNRDGRSILVVNNEYVNRHVFHGNRDSKKPENVDDMRKAKAGHGVSIAEISQRNGRWQVVKDSKFNRRITASTPIDIVGPAAGHDLLKTSQDPSGRRALGTYANCANGRTPWGTYLTCEENFNAYFSASDEFFEPTKQMYRYGIGRNDWGYNWAAFDPRFDVSKNPNEPNRMGYVVEIDPFDRNSTPRKRTALGRFKHENAEVVIAKSGQVVVYMGDDERGEFLYRFVSDDKFVDGGNSADLLDKGKLYVAKFNDDMTGKWLELTPQSTGMASRADICIHTRQAASKVGGTTMDRPEWVAAHPDRPEVYCSLTNNKNRGRKTNRGGDAMPVGGPNPRRKNLYGQIVRWYPQQADHGAPEFKWDLFAIAGNPYVHDDARAGSPNIILENMFNSPDGLSFDSRGQLWIRTDGNYSNQGDFAGMGNNQLLVGDPDSGDILRFLVGPRQCELTGLVWSPDRKTMFLGIQHPGAKGNGNFPGSKGDVPRSSIVAIRRDDGGVIG